MKPKSKAQKQLAAAKAVGKKRIAAESRRVEEQIESPLPVPVMEQKPGKKGKPEVVAPPVMGVFLDRSRRTHILTRTEGNTAFYLTAQDEEVRLVRMSRGGFEVRELIPYEYDVKKAVQKLYNWRLPKTSEAVREMCHILDLPVPDVPVEVMEKRAAKVERMKKVREALTSNKNSDKARQILTSGGFPTSVAIVTLVKEPTVVELNASRKALIALLAKNKKALTVSELRKAMGKPVGDSIMKLLALGVITLT